MKSHEMMVLIDQMLAEDPTMTLSDMGRRIGVSRERVRQVLLNETGISGADLTAVRRQKRVDDAADAFKTAPPPDLYLRKIWDAVVERGFSIERYGRRLNRELWTIDNSVTAMALWPSRTHWRSARQSYAGIVLPKDYRGLAEYILTMVVVQDVDTLFLIPESAVPESRSLYIPETGRYFNKWTGPRRRSDWLKYANLGPLENGKK